jgi:hypothetical protein
MYLYEPTLEAAASTVLMFWLQAWLRLMFVPKKYGGMWSLRTLYDEIHSLEHHQNY